MTWDELGLRIAQMSPEQSAGQVKFCEPYDDYKIFPVSVSELASDEPLRDEDGDTIQPGELFLE